MVWQNLDGVLTNG